MGNVAKRSIFYRVPSRDGRWTNMTAELGGLWKGKQLVKAKVDGMSAVCPLFSLGRMLGLAVLLVALLLGISIYNRSLSKTYWHANTRFMDRTETVTRSLQVHEGMNLVRIRLDVQLASGAVRWRLYDPSGQQRWQGSTVDTFQASQKLESIPGDWLLELELLGASGKYDVDWTAAGFNLAWWR